jgi:isoleucyl-tRNA synthetase
MYQDYFKKYEKTESIHFSDWPEIEKKYQDKKLEQGMDIVKKIVELSNSKRHDKEIKLRYKLKRLTVNTKDVKLIKNLSDIIGKMANVENVEFKKAEELTVELDTEPTPKLKEEWLLSELTRKIQASRKKMGFKIEEKVKLYLDESFKNHKEHIEKTTGTKITFGKIEGKKFDLLFDKKKYEFGIKI